MDIPQQMLSETLKSRDTTRFDPFCRNHVKRSLATQTLSDAIDHAPFAGPASIADRTRWTGGSGPIDDHAADANAGPLERPDPVLRFRQRHLFRQRHPVESDVPSIAQQRRQVTRLAGDELDQTIGRL